MSPLPRDCRTGASAFSPLPLHLVFLPATHPGRTLTDSETSQQMLWCLFNKKLRRRELKSLTESLLVWKAVI